MIQELYYLLKAKLVYHDVSSRVWQTVISKLRIQLHQNNRMLSDISLVRSAGTDSSHHDKLQDSLSPQIMKSNSCSCLLSLAETLSLRILEQDTLVHHRPICIVSLYMELYLIIWQ